MNVKALVIQRFCEYEGQYAPELFDAVDEHLLSDNPDYWSDRLAQVKQMAVSNEIISWAVVSFDLPDFVLMSVLAPERATTVTDFNIESSSDRPSKQEICGMHELMKSHAGGNDYSSSCVKTLDANGRHKGSHRTASGYTWAPAPTDRKF